jgi:hypothetical protein
MMEAACRWAPLPPGPPLRNALIRPVARVGGACGGRKDGTWCRPLRYHELPLVFEKARSGLDGAGCGEIPRNVPDPATADLRPCNYILSGGSATWRTAVAAAKSERT